MLRHQERLPNRILKICELPIGIDNELVDLGFKLLDHVQNYVCQPAREMLSRGLPCASIARPR